MSSPPEKYTIDVNSLLSVIRGFRNGIIYGTKVRFVHALVMTILFKNGTVYEKCLDVFTATYQHATNLGFFAAVFKSIRIILNYLRQKDDDINTLVAGMCGGYILFSKDDGITSQINMYIMSRIIFGCVRAGIAYDYLPYYSYIYPLFSATIWGIVMTLFFHHRGHLQKSMEYSMDYIYKQSDDVTPLPETYAGILDWIYQGD